LIDNPARGRDSSGAKVAPPNARRDVGALALVLFLIEFISKGPILLGSVALYQRDLMLVYFPLIQAILREASLGALPLRDPTSGFGQPLLADPSSQILYPPVWIHLFMPSPLAYAWFVSLHSVFGALGIALLARRLSSGSLLGPFGITCPVPRGSHGSGSRSSVFFPARPEDPRLFSARPWARRCSRDRRRCARELS
jgi:hypothetical protein